MVIPTTPKVDNNVVLPDVVNASPISAEPVVVNEFKAATPEEKEPKLVRPKKVVLPVIVSAPPIFVVPATPSVDNIVVLPDVVNAFPIREEPVVVNEFKCV